MKTTTSSLALDGTHLIAAARPRSSILVLLRAGVCALRDTILTCLRRRRAKQTHDALASLDDRMLRDLGLTRAEIGSISAEIAGLSERTRMQALQAPLAV